MLSLSLLSLLLSQASLHLHRFPPLRPTWSCAPLSGGVNKRVHVLYSALDQYMNHAIVPTHFGGYTHTHTCAGFCWRGVQDDAGWATSWPPPPTRQCSVPAEWPRPGVEGTQNCVFEHFKFLGIRIQIRIHWSGFNANTNMNISWKYSWIHSCLFSIKKYLLDMTGYTSFPKSCNISMSPSTQPPSTLAGRGQLSHPPNAALTQAVHLCCTRPWHVPGRQGVGGTAADIFGNRF